MMNRLIIVSQVTLRCLCGYCFKNLHHCGFFRLYTDVASASAPSKEASSVEDIWKGPAKKTVDKTRYTSLLLYKDPDRRASRSFILIIFSLAPVARKVDNAIRRINPRPLDNAFGFPHTYPPGQWFFRWIALSNFRTSGASHSTGRPLSVRAAIVVAICKCFNKRSN